MDNEKKLVQELLKSDGIDPAAVSDTERAAFREMLDSEQKRIKRISWCITGMMWIFAAAMICLCFSERVLEALHIPFAVAGIIAIVAIYAAIIPLGMRLYRQLTASKKKAIHLEKLVHGRRQSSGLVLVGVKDGKRFIHWPNIFLIIIAIWLLMSIGGAGVYYLLCSRWIFTAQPVFHIFFCVAASLAFVISGVYQGLKAPLEELADVKPEQYFRSKRISTLIFTVAIILVLFVGIEYFGGSIDMTGKVWADTVQRAQRARTCAYTQTLHYTGVAELPDMKMEVICKEQGYKRTSAGSMVSILNASKRKGIVINHSTKEYTEMDFSSQELDEPSRYDFFERMRTLPERANEVLGEKELNGRKTIGYRILEKGMNLTFWLDIDSRDLVLSELKFINAPGIYAVISDFRFDIEADDSLFSLKPPEGYTQRNIDVDRTEAGEKDLVEFLKLWAAQVSDGVFPPTLNLTELTKASIEMKKAGTTIKADTEDEKMRYRLKMTRGLMFVLQLKPESDWHYSGQDVKLGESEKVIFRYKPEDSPSWRVIYGDLSVKDVNEKDFPK